MVCVDVSPFPPEKTPSGSNGSLVLGWSLFDHLVVEIIYPPEVKHSPWKMVIGSLLSYWVSVTFSGENSLLNFAGIPVTSRAGPLSRSYSNNIQVYRGFKKPTLNRTHWFPEGYHFINHIIYFILPDLRLTLDIGGTFTPYKNDPGAHPKRQSPYPTIKRIPFTALLVKVWGVCAFQFHSFPCSDFNSKVSSHPLQPDIFLQNISFWFHALFGRVEDLCVSKNNGTPKSSILIQWLFLVPLNDGRDYKTPQKAIYKWYINGIYCQLGDYMPPTTF